MGKYEMNTADMRRFFNDIHTIATSLKTLSELTKKDAAKEEEKEALAREAALKTTIGDLLDSYASPYQIPVEPDPDEKG